MDDFRARRSRMVEEQIAARGLRDPHVLSAMSEVPREHFVAPDMTDHAYEDTPLPIGEGQTISQPFIVAEMIAAAEIRPGDHVLEIGAGSGYAAAVISRIADRVHAVERHPSLARSARDRLTRLGYRNVDVETGDGTLGRPEAAPFDAILVAAGGPEIPETLKRQLAMNGRLVMPVGDERAQHLLKLVREGEGLYRQEDLGRVRFVPLIGAEGWSEEAESQP